MDTRFKRCSCSSALVLVSVLFAILLAWSPARAIADDGGAVAADASPAVLSGQAATVETEAADGESAEGVPTKVGEAVADDAPDRGNAGFPADAAGADGAIDDGDAAESNAASCGTDALGPDGATDAADAGVNVSSTADEPTIGAPTKPTAETPSAKAPNMESVPDEPAAAGPNAAEAPAEQAAAKTAAKPTTAKPTTVSASTSKEDANGKVATRAAAQTTPGAAAKATSNAASEATPAVVAKTPSVAAAQVKTPSVAATQSEASGKTANKVAIQSKAASKTAAKTASKTSSKTAADAVLSCRGHAQSFGWLKAVGSGELCGTSGKGKRLEALTLKVNGFPYTGSIKYQAHVQTIGWQKAVADGAIAGTSGKSLRVEALKIWLTGDLAKHYDVIYRGHVQGIGWRSWVKNGGSAGSTGQSRRLEAIEVVLTPKTVEATNGSKTEVGVRAQAHVQGIGWQPWVGNGNQVGTSGQSRRVEGMNILLSAGNNKGGIRYKAHVQGIGWQDWIANGKMMGTSGQSRRVEALCVELTGDIKSKYDIYYSAHVQNCGWTGWAKNGERAGSTGCSYRCEAIKVKLVKKGAAAPGSRKDLLFTRPVKKELDGIDISSWQPDINIPGVDADFVIVKSTEGEWYTNPYFYEHANQVLSSGKLLGSYHFANEGSAVGQADFFVKAIGPYIGKCALFLDWENTNYSDTMSQGPSWAKQFMDRVYARTGVVPLIYTSANVTRSYDWSSVAKKYDLWLAQYPDYEETGYLKTPWVDGYGNGAWSSPKLHQYTSSGLISGYSGHLDLNKFYGTAGDWGKMASKR